MELSFDPRLAYELALELDSPAAIFARYGYDTDGIRHLLSHATFKSTLQKYKEEIREGGVSFKLKAKIQAEDLLTHSYALAVDPQTPASVRADLIKWTAKVADLEPKQDKNAVQAGQGFQLNITFAGNQPTVALSGGPVIEGEVSR